MLKDLCARAPLVVGTLSARPISRPGLAACCDAVEIRLDLATETEGWLAESTSLDASGFPVIVTLRLAGEGGGWTGDDEARQPLLESALEAVAAIDVERRSALMPALCDRAAALGKTVIVSHHNFDSTPPLDELLALVEDIRQYPAAIPKLATMVTGEADVDVLKALIETTHRDGPVCVVGMGWESERTRAEFPRLGSCLTYGYLDRPVAPGQVPARELKVSVSSWR